MTASPRPRDRAGQADRLFAVPADRLPLFIRFSSWLSRTIFRLSTRVTIEGLENAPRSGRLIIAANHLSNADPPLLAGWLTPALGRPVHWMSKAELLAVPFVGWYLRHNATFGIRRGAADTEAFRLARRVLDEDRVLGTFPEGTRSSTGGLQEAKDGVTLLALRTGAPILPVGVVGTDRFWPRGRPLWRLGGRVSMRVGKPFALERGVGPDGAKESLEDVTTRLMLHVAELIPEEHRGVYGTPSAGFRRKA